MIALCPPHKNQLGNYTSWLEKRGLPFRILKEGEKLDNYTMLLLCGGPDVGSAEKRDKAEFDWLKEAFGKMPILGICRGLQLTNVFLEGSLHEDLSEAVVKHTSNKKEIAGEPAPLLESSWHEVQLESGQSIRVNSRHHQGISVLGKGLEVMARCPYDNLVEMAKGDKMLLVQWHPEREDVWGTEAEKVVYDWIVENYREGEVVEKEAEISPLEKILSYLNNKNFTVVSNERIRKSIDPSFSDAFIDSLVRSNPSMLKRVKDKHGKTAVKKL